MAKNHGHGHGHHHGHGDPLANPDHLAEYLARLEGPDRAAWQQPDTVVAKLGLKQGDRVCEVGSGSGYFTLRLARAVGPRGRVVAIDAEPKVLDLLRARLHSEHLEHVELIAATDGAALPSAPVNRVVMVNTYHHFKGGPEYLRSLATMLLPGGSVVNIDFHDREIPLAPPPDHRISRDAFLTEARSAGLVLVREETFLPHQYFVEIAPPR